MPQQCCCPATRGLLCSSFFDRRLGQHFRWPVHVALGTLCVMQAHPVTRLFLSCLSGWFLPNPDMMHLSTLLSPAEVICLVSRCDSRVMLSTNEFLSCLRGQGHCLVVLSLGYCFVLYPLKGFDSTEEPESLQECKRLVNPPFLSIAILWDSSG